MTNFKNLSLLLASASFALASPRPLIQRHVVTVTETVSGPAETPAWDTGAVVDYPIHESCNSTEVHMLKRGISEMIKLAEHARDHILRFGNSSEIYTKYFGSAATAEPIGWFEKVVRGDRGDMLFRCDNPDGNCALEGWGGHWRGSNATSETVICPLSYSTRHSLESLCALGYTIAGYETNFYFASDLLHRVYHVPQIGEEIVEHYAGEYLEVLELAKTNPEEAVRNSDTLQYFALEAYAFDIAVPGVGCVGEAPEPTEGDHDHGHAATSTVPDAPSMTSAAPAECHTHSDGVVHCT
ncbi:zincin [Patellaria atrata CBS 101060]|uniref:Zincin n=1 Tax=Patellaria atrata CBS 101060 TaxID=1346257 RepID=A0A9P4SE18_9PEZI|nr:zincin [Patellaria atrata CBS 101060]